MSNRAARNCSSAPRSSSPDRRPRRSDSRPRHCPSSVGSPRPGPSRNSPTSSVVVCPDRRARSCARSSGRRSRSTRTSRHCCRLSGARAHRSTRPSRTSAGSPIAPRRWPTSRRSRWPRVRRSTTSSWRCAPARSGAIWPMPMPCPTATWSRWCRCRSAPAKRPRSGRIGSVRSSPSCPRRSRAPRSAWVQYTVRWWTPRRSSISCPPTPSPR